MDKKASKTLLFCVIGIMITFPIIINCLMFFKIFPVKGNIDTWIPTLGTFWGAIIGGVISGILTLIGVQLTIKHNNELKKKEEFPEKLYRLEKVLTLLETTSNDFENLMALDFGEKVNIFFEINNHLNITKTEKHSLYTEKLLEKINNDIVFVNSISYRMFFETRRKINDLYNNLVWEVEYRLFEFTQDLIKEGNNQGIDVLNTNWSELDLDAYQSDVIQEIERELYKCERKYLFHLSEQINDLKFQLNDHYFELIEKIDY